MASFTTVLINPVYREFGKKKENGVNNKSAIPFFHQNLSIHNTPI